MKIEVANETENEGAGESHVEDQLRDEFCLEVETLVEGEDYNSDDDFDYKNLWIKVTMSPIEANYMRNAFQTKRNIRRLGKTEGA